MQWEAIASIAAKIGCSGETLRKWVRQAERDRGVRAGQTSEERDPIKALKREVRELRQANLREASTCFALAPFAECEHSAAGQGELDRQFKP